MSEPSTFGAELKRRRIERGLTQEALGERVGYTGQTIRRIEAGRRRPSLQLALRLCEVLELGPAEQAVWMHAARSATDEDAATEVAQPYRLAVPPSLPTYLTPFVGRAQEQAELAALLERPDARLITVLGPGGAGKTRLAIETSRAHLGVAGNVAFVALAPVTAPAVIVPAIGDALGVSFSGTRDPLVQLIAHLRNRRVLLILDNLEHLLDRAGVTLGVLEQVLHQTEAVTVLATSRERLRLAGEWVLELDGLAVPQLDASMAPDDAPALTLFLEHAERVGRAVRLTPESREVITTICRTVDGMPLGIELAAAWLRLLALEEIAQHLTSDLEAAPLAQRPLPTRHRSLRAVVDHSWQLLSAGERAVLCRLSVFQGGFTRDAAAHVAGANIAVLADLVDKSLLRRSDGGRYDLHEIIRQYAAARLHEHDDETAATCGRHAAYYLRLVAERGVRLRSAEQMATLAELNAEIDNIRAAWPWAAAHALYEELEGAGEVLQWFFEFRRWFQDGALLFAQGVERLRSSHMAVDQDASRRTLGRLLGHYGYLAARSGAFAAANDALVESYMLLDDGRDPVGLSRTLVHQGMAALWVGNYTAARHALERSLALAQATGDRSITGASLTWASILEHAVGEYGAAERLFGAALTTFRAMGDPRAMIWCITYCGSTLVALGKYGEAERLLRESVALCRVTDDRYGMAASLHALGRAALEQHKLAEAIALLREALPVLRSAGTWAYAQALNDLGAALWQSGAAADAAHTYREGLAAALELEAVPEALHAMSGLAVWLAHQHRYASAYRFAARILADPASREAGRRRAAEVQDAARRHLSADELARSEQQAAALPLAEALAELERAGVSA